MKYVVWDFDEIEQKESDERQAVNMGNTAMAMSVEYILKNMQIEDKDIIHLKTSEMFSYNGEFALCPICTCTDILRGKNISGFSRKIIPVFLSLSVNAKYLSQQDLLYYRQYEPVGCRDEETLEIMRKNGIKSFLTACMASLVPKKREGFSGGKIFFVDVPKIALKYVPEEIKKDVEFIKQEKDLTDLSKGVGGREFGLSMIEKYRKEAKMIVSSRFHAAVVGISMGMPVIIINENYTFRFSWLRKIAPFYTRNEISDIDWNPKPVEFESLKEKLLANAKKQMEEAIDRWSSILEVSEILIEKNFSPGEQIDYYDDAIDYIKKNWNHNEEIQFSFWGVNNNARAIYEYISENYTNAKLVAVYDMFKQLEFEGVKSVTPDAIAKDNQDFIFVTTFVAGYVAEDVFHRKDIPDTRYYICDREYITEEDL